ncbi:MAG: hypothetical protein O2970_11020 [Proteobacteria bacterium]|nr:hypothetical protein [Pseudomonadota bacterium]
MQVISLRSHIDNIKAKYGKYYWREPQTDEELKKLWGFPDCNEHGVFKNVNEEEVINYGQTTALVKICQAPNKKWVMSLSYSMATEGYCSPVSLWNDTAYYSYDDAKIDGINELIEIFKRKADNESNYSERNREEFKNVIAMLKAQKTPQLDLF